MTDKELIYSYASEIRGPFTRKDLLDWALAHKQDINKASLNITLHRMLEGGMLLREGRGIYGISSTSSKHFHITPGQDSSSYYSSIRKTLPFTNLCVWDAGILVPFMQHIPDIREQLVEVERIAMDTVFEQIRTIDPGKTVLLNPTLTEYLRYGSGQDLVVVKPLVSEAPTEECNGIVVPTLEKILVDISIDPEFNYIQGDELLGVYENILERFEINKKKLLRYAGRRGHKEEIEELLNIVGHD